MRQAIIILMLANLTFITFVSNAQTVSDVTTPCKLLLQNGLYKFIIDKKTEDFNLNLKEYLQSEKFKSDYSNNKWSAGIEVIIEGIPVGLKGNSNQTQVSAFQEKVKSSKELTVSNNFYHYTSIAVPDIELAQKYNECVIGLGKFGFKLYPSIDNDAVTFIVNYTREFEADPMPKITDFIVKGGEIFSATGVDVGKTIPNNLTIIINRKPDQILTFILQTDKGIVSYKVEAEAAGLNKDLPVGTIISSYLSFDQFTKVTQNNINSPNGLWTSKYSKWSPADGRPVLNSKFQEVTNDANVPDLRGVFLRGLNTFDTYETTTVPARQQDPEVRKAGSFEADELKSHNHQWGNDESGGTNGGYIKEGNFGHYKFTTTNTGGNETRPKNVAIYYYIRIN